MKRLIQAGALLVVLAGAAFAQYPWPVYPPFNPGSWAWPMYPLLEPPPAPPPVTVVYPAPAAPVVLYQEIPAPPRRVRRAQPEPPQPSAYGSPLYLIAFKDGMIRAAAAFWVDDGTLHYIGRDRVAHDAPLDSVDRALSTQLNRERRVPFRLPEAE